MLYYIQCSRQNSRRELYAIFENLKSDDMSLIPNEFKNAVVSIGVRTGNGDILWSGTGFLLCRTLKEGEKKDYPFLVSNRHVFNNKGNIAIRLMKKDTGELVILDLPLLDADGKPLFHTHGNPEIDIAVLPLDVGMLNANSILFYCFDVDNNLMDSEGLRSNGADEGSLVYMLGFPMRLVNVDSGLPICRLGCIARCSRTQIEETGNILVDIQNFPGNSGSPIILRPEQMTLKGTPNCPKCKLIGIVHSYIPYIEELMNTQTKQVVEIRSENSGLAWVHPAEYILELIDQIVPQSVPSH